jgi:hypothetical protein
MAYTQRGFSPFTKKKDKEYEPQTKTRGYKGSEHTDSTPQTKRQKMPTWRLESQIEGIFDNEYSEAKERGDKSEIARYERQMLNLKKEIEKRGGKYTHINMSKFKG